MQAPWMKTAEAELGVKEIKGAKKNEPRILEYLKTVGKFLTDETAWCSAFANWVMAQSGYNGTHKANARSWLNWGYPIPTPTYGCIVIFKRGKSSWQGHVAFYVESEGTNLKVLGGNQGDAVSVKPYPKSRVLGYRWPVPVGQVITRDSRGRVVSSNYIEGMTITASPTPK